MKKRRRPAPAAPPTPPPVSALPPASSIGRGRIALTLTVFAVAFIVLAAWSLTGTSATWDEPVHLTDGYLSLTKADYRADPEHPPFARMWAALPLAVMGGITADTASIDSVPSLRWAGLDLFLYAHRFLYVDNDADRLLYAGRFMIVMLGVLLGIMVFFWAYEWLGYWPAVVALALFLLEPNLLAHSQLVTTDLPLTTFLFGAVYFLWRFARQATRLNAAAVVVFATLAILTKFSAVLLVPIVLLLLAVGVLARRITLMHAASLLAACAVVSFIAIWAIYGFRWAPSASAGWYFHFEDSRLVRQNVPSLTELVTWIDSRHLLPNTFTQGLLIGQAKAVKRSAFLAGNYSEDGWWYFFPLAFLLKTPIGLMALAAFAVPAIRRARGEMLSALFVICPIVIYFGASVGAGLNIGLRHILPIYPFVIVLAGFAASHLIARERQIGWPIIGVCLSLVVLEAGRSYPHSLAFFNQLAGGPAGGSRYFIDSSLDWGQDLKGLKAWMTKQGVEHINLGYFGSADPKYYGIDCTYLPGSPIWLLKSQIGLPKLPGYVAVSATAANGIYLEGNQFEFYKPLMAKQPVASIGHSIDVYWVDEPWWY